MWKYICIVRLGKYIHRYAEYICIVWLGKYIHKYIHFSLSFRNVFFVFCFCKYIQIDIFLSLSLPEIYLCLLVLYKCGNIFVSFGSVNISTNMRKYIYIVRLGKYIHKYILFQMRCINDTPLVQIRCINDTLWFI